MKNKLISGAISMLLCAVFMTAALASCTGSTAAMKLDNEVITDRMYYYWYKQYRDYFLSAVDGAEDTDEFWSSEISEGVTTEEYMTQIVNTNVMKNLVCMKLFRDYGLTLSSDATQSVEDDLADLVDSYGSKAALNAELADYEINYDILRQIYIIQEEISAVYDYLYGDNGVLLPSDAELDAYYRENYARIKYITIHLYKEVTDDDGNTSSIALTDAETEQKRALASDLADQLKAGADIDALRAEYDDEDLTGYENGVYISTANTGYDIIDAALAMEIGETITLEQTNAIYIVQRLELEDAPYLDDTMDQFSSLLDNCSDEVFQNMLTGYFSQIEFGDTVSETAEK